MAGIKHAWCYCTKYPLCLLGQTWSENLGGGMEEAAKYQGTSSRLAQKVLHLFWLMWTGSEGMPTRYRAFSLFVHAEHVKVDSSQHFLLCYLVCHYYRCALKTKPRHKERDHHTIDMGLQWALHPLLGNVWANVPDLLVWDYSGLDWSPVNLVPQCPKQNENQHEFSHIFLCPQTFMCHFCTRHFAVVPAHLLLFLFRFRVL